MIVVSNTSPLTNLAAIGAFDLLQALFGEIHIAQGVWLELNAGDRAYPGSVEVARSEWVQQHTVGRSPLVEILRRDLDLGESETLALAVHLKADLVLMDEREGRLAADRMGLTTIGVLGLLVTAKKKNLLKSVQPWLKKLRDETGFYLGDALYRKILEEVSE